jgi:hypothetical protein
VKKTPSSLLPQLFKKIDKKFFFSSSSSFFFCNEKSKKKCKQKRKRERERERERERDPYATNANKAFATDAPGRLLDASL